MAVVKNMMVRVGADFSSLTTGSKTAASATKSWAAKTTASFQQVGASSAGLSTATTRVSRFSTMMKSAGAMLLTVFGVQQLIQFGKASIEAASDLAEVQNVVDVVFGSLSGRVDQFAQSAAEAYGLSETMAKRFVGTYGAMATSFGFSKEAAYDMATTLTGLAGDVASFYNISQDEAYTKLKSVFSGETETLKDLGIVMTQSALDAYALANGYGKTTSAMSELEKVSLRYAFVQDQLSNAAGDFTRTSDGWANQIRVLQLNFQSLQAIIGSGLIALLTPFVRGLNTALSALVKFGNAVSNVFSAVFGTKQKTVSGAVIEDVNDYSTSLDGLGSSASGAASAAKELKRQVLGFDQITKLSDTSSGSGGSGSVGGSGAGVGAGAGGSSLLEEAAETTTKFSGIMQKFHDWLAGLNLEPIQTAWDKLRTAGGKLVEVINGGLQWGLENVLAPLAKWTLEKGAPALITTMATAFETLADALIVIQPWWDWCYRNIFGPIGKQVGNTFTRALEGLSTVLGILDGYLKDITEVMNGDRTLGDMLLDWFSFDRQAGEAKSLLGIAGGWLGQSFSLIQPLLPTTAVTNAVVNVAMDQSADDLWQDFDKEWGDDRTVSIQNVLANTAKSLWDTFQKGWGVAKSKTVEIWNQLKNGAAVLWQGFSTGWGTARQRVVEIWNQLKNSAASLWQGFSSGWGSRAVSIFNSLANSAGTLWSGFAAGWGTRGVSIVNSLLSSAGTLWNRFASGWGTRAVSIVNTLLNSAQDLWNQFKAGWSGKTLGLTITYSTNVSGIKKAVYKALGLKGWPSIRFAARGGIVNAATLLGNTVVGEAGREAIIPLENHTEWIDLVARRLAASFAGGTPNGGARPLIVQVVLDGRVVGQTAVDYINGQTKSSGASPLVI